MTVASKAVVMTAMTAEKMAGVLEQKEHASSRDPLVVGIYDLEENHM